MRPILKPGENLYGKVKQVVPGCILRFSARNKFSGIQWPAVWAPGSFHQFGDATGAAHHWTERTEMDFLEDGVRVYLAYFGDQRGVSWQGASRYIEGLREDEAKRKAPNPTVPFLPLQPPAGQ